jgi:hypothetical protein
LWLVLRLVAVKILTVLEMKSVDLSLVVVSQEKNVNRFVIQETVPWELIVQLAIIERLVLVDSRLKEMVMQLV